jgi:hypothetical protein
MRLISSNDTTHTLREIAAWKFTSSGNFTEDCARGRGLARQFIDQSHVEGFVNTLGYLVGRLVERGEPLSGLEIGFLKQLSSHMAGNDCSPRLTLCSA